MASQGWSVDSFLENRDKGPDQRMHPLLDWLAALCILACLVSYHVGWQQSPILFKWLPVGALALVALARTAWAARFGAFHPDAVDGLAVLLLAWVGVTLAWSPDAQGGRDVLIKWALLTAVFIGFRRGMSHESARIVAGGIALGLIGIMLLDRLHIARSGGYFNQNYETEALLFALPFLVVFFSTTRPWQRWSAWLLATATVLFLVFLNPSKIEFLIWAGVGMYAALVLLWRRSRLRALAAFAFVAAITIALAYFGWDRPLFNESHGFRESIYPRLELLANGIAMWRDALLLGHGAGFMYPVYPLYQEHYIPLLGTSYKTALLTNFYASAGALHNDYIQFLAGFGLVGFGLVVAGIIAARRTLAVWRASTPRVAGLGAVLACLMAALVDFPLQNAATAALAILGLAWLLPSTQDSQAPRSPWSERARILPAILLVCSLPATGFWAYRYYLGHEAFGTAQRIGNTRPDISLQLNMGAAGAYPYESAFRLQLYNTLMFMEESGISRFPPEVHDQVFATSLSTGPANSLMIFRLEYLLNSGRYKERQEEVAKWRRQLTTNVTRLPDTWLMEGLYAVAENDGTKAKAALERYLDLTGGAVADDRRAIVESIRQGVAH